MRLDSGHVTAMIPGFVLQSKALSGSSGRLFYSYDPTTLVQDFPMLDVEQSFPLRAADVVTISLFGSGTARQAILSR